jgi:hypothetical protein
MLTQNAKCRVQNVESEFYTLHSKICIQIGAVEEK